MEDNKKEKWESSYSRKENFIYYPKEQVVKFLNRFVRKKSGYNSFTQLLNPENSLKGLDLGCGIGRQTVLLEEFGIDSYGLDISSVALTEAVYLAKHLGFEMKDKFILLTDNKLPFDDDYFDVAISDSVLDSMEYKFAKIYMAELNRTVKNYVYISLISDKSFNTSEDNTKDVVVDDLHEEGTIQSYYNVPRINDLISGTTFKIKALNLITEDNLLTEGTTSRYHIVLSK
jgi:ubiquinone/menaquinone biosynthesis C-methylase UbiE